MKIIHPRDGGGHLDEPAPGKEPNARWNWHPSMSAVKLIPLIGGLNCGLYAVFQYGEKPVDTLPPMKDCFGGKYILVTENNIDGDPNPVPRYQWHGLVAA